MKTFLLCYTKGYPRVVTLAESSLSMCLTSCWSAWPPPAPCLARLSWRLEYPEPELVTVSITCKNTCLANYYEIRTMGNEQLLNCY